MHIGNHYKFVEFILWTRRDIYKLILIATIPTAAFKLLGYTWLAIPWVPVALMGTAAAFIVGFKNTQTYNRLWEARQIWGSIVNTSRAVGEIHRFGQSKNSGCCGAARAALAKLKENTINPGEVTDIDYQMNTIEQILLAQRDRVLQAPNQLIAATQVIYEAIDRRILELVEKTRYNCRYVLLMGAILINSDSDVGSFTTTNRFDVIDLQTGVRSNRMDFFTQRN